MKKFLSICIVFLCIINSTPAMAQAKIILKLDDVSVKNGTSNDNSKRTLDYIISKKIKASFGLIASRNDETAISFLGKYLNAKDANGDRLIEIWHHGYDHVRPEFDGTGYAYQKKHFDDATNLLNRLLNIEMKSFGAPFNGTDADTNIVVSEDPRFKVTMFQNPAPNASTGLTNFNNRVNLENGTGNPEYDYFVSNYNQAKGNLTDFMVLQGHPNSWNTTRLDDFKKVIDFLIAEGCEFILPYEYYLTLNPSISTPSTNQTIIFPDLMPKKTASINFTPQATSTSGLQVIYNSSNPEVATIVNGQIQIVGAGTSVITASQIGDATFKSADYVSKTLTVTPSLKILLKLDDIVVKNGTSNGKITLDYLMENKIKASFGLVASRNDESTLSFFSNYMNAKDKNGDRLIEIWNHGWDHRKPEFGSSRNYTYQKKHFEDADTKLNRLFNIKMTTFGAPFNDTSTTTNTVVSENSNYKVTYFQNPSPNASTGISNFVNRVNIENGTNNTDYDFFVTNYNAAKGRFTNFMTLQGHPERWTEARLSEFKRIIEFLIAEGCEFELPYEYYLTLNPNVAKPSTTQTITFPDMMTQSVGNADFSPGAMSDSGLDVVYNSSDVNVATIIDGKVHIVGSGTSIITASQIGNATYKSADYISKTLTVDSNLSVESVINDKFNYVNPVSDFLVVNAKEKMLSLKVFDTSGKLVLDNNINSNKAKVNVSKLNSAIYIVYITTSKGKENFKIIKN